MKRATKLAVLLAILSVAAVYSADKERGAAIDGQIARIGRAIATLCTNACSVAGLRQAGARNPWSGQDDRRRPIAFGGELSEDAMIDLNDTLKIARPNQWPERAVYSGQWCHSDLKNVAYFFNFKFFDKAIKKGNLK